MTKQREGMVQVEIVNKAGRKQKVWRKLENVGEGDVVVSENGKDFPVVNDVVVNEGVVEPVEDVSTPERTTEVFYSDVPGAPSPFVGVIGRRAVIELKRGGINKLEGILQTYGPWAGYGVEVDGVNYRFAAREVASVKLAA